MWCPLSMHTSHVTKRKWEKNQHVALKNKLSRPWRDDERDTWPFFFSVCQFLLLSDFVNSAKNVVFYFFNEKQIQLKKEKHLAKNTIVRSTRWTALWGQRSLNHATILRKIVKLLVIPTEKLLKEGEFWQFQFVTE